MGNHSMSLISTYWAVLLWFLASVVFALGPLIISFLTIAVDKEIDVGWEHILKDGELFFFSTAISASTLYSSFDKLLIAIDAKSGLNEKAPILVFVAFCSIFLLFISTAYSGILTYLKLRQESRDPQNTNKSLNQESYRKIGFISISIAILTSVLNFVVNIFL